MRVTVASGRGLLAGWLIAATLPLLLNPHSVAAWSSTGLGDPARVALAAVELLGAALFAFERTIVAGFALLVASFVAAAVIHLHHDEMPWWLIAYAVTAILLLYCTRIKVPSAKLSSSCSAR
jgi:DoxX-like family